MSSRNSFPEDHHLFAGFLFAGREEIVSKLAGRDLILVLGAQVFTYHVEGFGPHVPEGARLFQLTEDAGIASFAPVGTSVITSIKPALAALLQQPSSEQRDRPTIAPRPASPSASPLSDAWLMHRIAELMPKGAIIVEEAASARSAMHAHLPIRTRDSFYTCASGGLGYSLPAAIGVALGRPGEKVICLLGDGSAMYTIQGLWTAAHLDLPISYVIFNNGGYAALESFSKRFGLTSLVGTQIAGLDFVKIAEGQGLNAQRVSDASRLDTALTQSFAAKGPTLIDVVIG
jgi:benzoylformate decarboxylase